MEEQTRSLQLVIGKLGVFVEMVRDRLATADWPLRRDIVRTLVKRIEVTDDVVRIVFRVEPGSSEPLTALPHCQTGGRALAVRHAGCGPRRRRAEGGLIGPRREGGAFRMGLVAPSDPDERTVGLEG